MGHARAKNLSLFWVKFALHERGWNAKGVLEQTQYSLALYLCVLRLLWACERTRLGIKIKRNESRAAIKGRSRCGRSRRIVWANIIKTGGAGRGPTRVEKNEPPEQKMREKRFGRTMQSAEVHTPLLNLLARNHFDNAERERSRGDFSGCSQGLKSTNQRNLLSWFSWCHDSEAIFLPCTRSALRWLLRQKLVPLNLTFQFLLRVYGGPILIPLIKMNAKPRTVAHFGVIAPIILAHRQAACTAARQLIRNLPSGAREIETNCAPAAGPKLGSGTLKRASSGCRGPAAPGAWRRSQPTGSETSPRLELQRAGGGWKICTRLRGAD